MSEIKIGSVVRLKSDVFVMEKHFFTVNSINDGIVELVGFTKVERSLIKFTVNIECLVPHN